VNRDEQHLAEIAIVEAQGYDEIASGEGPRFSVGGS